MTCVAAAPTRCAASLWLVRHAKPLVEPGVCYGASDIAADLAATRIAATALAQVLPPGLPILSSPLKRCAQLAIALRAQRPDLTSSPDLRLAEMNFGSFEGMRWSDIPQAALSQWTDDFGTCRLGGVESVQDVMLRVAAVWDGAVARQQDVVWITHAGVIRAANLLAKGLRFVSRADQWPTAAIAFGEIQTIALPPS